MCGIVGLITSSNFGQILAREKLFAQMLYTDQLRGEDSTGIALIPERGDIEIYKRAYPAADFLQLPRAKALINRVGSSQAVIGHNRAATKGAVSHENAHPFRANHITLVHNGSLTSWYNLTKRGTYSVDSEAIAVALSESPVEDVIPKLFGAYSLVWHDDTDNSLNFIRNNERPMTFIELKSTVQSASGWAFGSEHMLLQALIWRNNIDRGPVRITEPHVLYKFDLDNPAEYTARRISTVGKFEGAPTHTRSRPYGNSLDSRPKASTDVGNEQVQTLPKPRVTMDQSTIETHKGLLKKYDLEMNTRIDILPIEFIPYETEKMAEYGAVHCLIAYGTDPSNTVRGILYGCTKGWFDSLSNGKFDSISAVVSGYRNDLEAVTLHNAIIHRATTKVVDIKKHQSQPSSNDSSDSYEYDDEDVTTESYVRGPAGVYIPRAKWEVLAKDGCASCGEHLDAVQSEFITWTRDGSPVCPACENDLKALVSLL